jgi:hypothetical protein
MTHVEFEDWKRRYKRFHSCARSNCTDCTVEILVECSGILAMELEQRRRKITEDEWKTSTN